MRFDIVLTTFRLVFMPLWHLCYIGFMQSRISGSIEETEKIAAKWLSDVARSHPSPDEAVLVGLSGHLGAGKTAFVKAVAKALGVAETVTSPTFVIMKIYEVGEDSLDIPWRRLVHIDAYRLERAEELEALSFEKLVADSHNLIMVEWPENVGLTQFSPLSDIKIKIEDGKHEFTIQ